MEGRVEKRLRIRQRDDVTRGYAKMNPQTVNYLGIGERLEVIVGNKKLTFNAFPNEGVPENEVWCNSDELREEGIADYTIASTRSFTG